jgi:hypothetical protein
MSHSSSDPLTCESYMLLWQYSNSAHGAEPFLKSRQSLSHSRISQHFMEPEGSLPCSQEPSNGLYPSYINPAHTTPSYLSKIHFKIILPPTSLS